MLLCAYGWSAKIDLSKMFITEERTNSYSLDAKEAEGEKDSRRSKRETRIEEEEAKKKSPLLTEKSTLVYNTLFGIESQSGYDNYGYGFVGSVIRPMPQKWEQYPGFYIQGDLLYTFRAMKSSSVNKPDLDYMVVSGYAGYEKPINETNTFTMKAGVGYANESNDFDLVYGVGLVRKLKTDKYKFVFELTSIKEFWLVGLGVRYKL